MRVLLLVLVLANVLLALGLGGVVPGWGLPDGREPQRWADQIEPQKLQIVQVDRAHAATENIANIRPLTSTEVAQPASQAASNPNGAEAAGRGLAAPASGASAQAGSSSAGPERSRPETGSQAIEGSASRGDSAPGRAQELVCRVSPVLSVEAARALRAPLTQRLGAAGLWAEVPVSPRPRWVVYMGPFAGTADLERKRSQLAVLKVAHNPLREGPLALGLSLGVFSTEAGAQQALATLATRGVRTARVLPEPLSAASTGLRLRFEALTPAQLQALAGVAGLGALQACGADSATRP